MEDKRIVALFHARDEGAIREARQAYGKQLSALALRVLGDSRDAVGRLEEDLLAERLPAKRRNFRPLAVAAILAAALCVTAGAAYLVAPEFFYYHNGGETQFAARTEYGGVVLPQDRIEAFLAEITAAREVDDNYFLPYEFDTVAQMEEFLGLDLLTTDQNPDRGCYFDIWSRHPTAVDENTLRISVHFHTMKATSRNHKFFVYANIALEDAAGTRYSQAQEGVETFVYDIENLGTTASIATGVYKSNSTVAYFVKDGIAYEVETFSGDVEYMKALLDSFHY